MRWLLILLGVALVGTMLWFLGPRVPVDLTITFDPRKIGPDLDAWLSGREATVPALVPELAKEIVWADPATKAKTPLALVYVHGFSASKGEIRPLPDLVAKALGANLFYTRLAGHGQDGPAMATATVNAWVNDLAEAIEIGRRIGDEVVVLATSTGGGMTVWASTQPTLMRDVKGIVLFSPNLGVQARGSRFLTMPWSPVIAGWMGERGFKPASELQARLWTERYPTTATLPMAAITKVAAATLVEASRVPVLVFISDRDRTVRPDITRQIIARWGAPHEIVTVDNAEDAGQHVIAGDAYSPSATAPAAAKVVEWIKASPPSAP